MQASMRIERPGRGFEVIYFPVYADPRGRLSRLVGQSSAIDNTHRGFDNPGSSFLWVGSEHHLSREEAEELARRILQWVNTGSLEFPPEQKGA